MVATVFAAAIYIIAARVPLIHCAQVQHRCPPCPAPATPGVHLPITTRTVDKLALSETVVVALVQGAEVDDTHTTCANTSACAGMESIAENMVRAIAGAMPVHNSDRASNVSGTTVGKDVSDKVVTGAFHRQHSTPIAVRSGIAEI